MAFGLRCASCGVWAEVCQLWERHTTAPHSRLHAEDVLNALRGCPCGRRGWLAIQLGVSPGPLALPGGRCALGGGGLGGGRGGGVGALVVDELLLSRGGHSHRLRDRTRGAENIHHRPSGERDRERGRKREMEGEREREGEREGGGERGGEREGWRGGGREGRREREEG